MIKKTAILLINVGTPDKPEVKYVRRFLFQFLNDKRVIDLPWIFRKILVNLIIVPFRAYRSTKAYRLLWKSSGSPLIFYINKLKVKLQKLLPDKFKVFVAMRYGKPSLKSALNIINRGEFEKVIVLPMFPQYASSTTGTIVELIMNEISKWNIIPDIRFINQFFNHKGFIDAFAQRAVENRYKDYDHIIFSYHGLPMRQIQKNHPEKNCNNCTCDIQMPEFGAYCYRATCYETSRLLADKLQLTKETYTVAFQSRMSKNWLEPFSDRVIVEKAKEGIKKILVLAPAFVADCLETEVEIGIEYAELFKNNGGEELTMAASLNDMDEWAETIKSFVTN